MLMSDAATLILVRGILFSGAIKQTKVGSAVIPLNDLRICLSHATLALTSRLLMLLWWTFESYYYAREALRTGRVESFLTSRVLAQSSLIISWSKHSIRDIY